MYGQSLTDWSIGRPHVLPLGCNLGGDSRMWRWASVDLVKWVIQKKHKRYRFIPCDVSRALGNSIHLIAWFSSLFSELLVMSTVPFHIEQFTLLHDCENGYRTARTQLFQTTLWLASSKIPMCGVSCEMMRAHCLTSGQLRCCAAHALCTQNIHHSKYTAVNHHAEK